MVLYAIFFSKFCIVNISALVCSHITYTLTNGHFCLMLYCQYKYCQKQCPQGPHKLSSLNHLKFKTLQRYRVFSLLQPSTMASLLNYKWQNRKERPNRSTNNEDMIHMPKCFVVCM